MSRFQTGGLSLDGIIADTEVWGTRGNCIGIGPAERVAVTNCHAHDSLSNRWGIVVSYEDIAVVLVSGCEVHDTASDGMHVSGGSQITLSDNFVYSTGDDAIGIGESGSGQRPEDIIVTGNVLVNCGSRGVAVMGTRDILVQGNVIDGTFQSGIAVENFDNFGDIADVSLIGNKVSNAGLAGSEHNPAVTGEAHGIYVRGNYGESIADVLISANTIARTTNSFVRVDAEVQDGEDPFTSHVDRVVVSDNTLLEAVKPNPYPENQDDPGQYHGIWVTRSNEISIVDNHLRNALQSGVLVDDTCCGLIRVTGNNLAELNSLSSSGQFGISVDQDCANSEVVVTDNVIDGEGSVLTAAVSVLDSNNFASVWDNVGVATIRQIAQTGETLMFPLTASSNTVSSTDGFILPTVWETFTLELLWSCLATDTGHFKVQVNYYNPDVGDNISIPSDLGTTELDVGASQQFVLQRSLLCVGATWDPIIGSFSITKSGGTTSPVFPSSLANIYLAGVVVTRTS